MSKITNVPIVICKNPCCQSKLHWAVTYHNCPQNWPQYLPIFIGPSVLRATSGLAEQLRETIILGIFFFVFGAVVVGTFLAFTADGFVVVFYFFAWVRR